MVPPARVASAVRAVQEDLHPGAVGRGQQFHGANATGLIEDLERDRPMCRSRPAELACAVARQLLAGHDRVGRSAHPVDGHGRHREGLRCRRYGAGICRGMSVIAERAAQNPSSILNGLR